jgi:ribose 1,5-bisphosphokinase PhnN
VAQLDARPLLIVISGPSGAGKGTALDHVTRTLPLRRIPTYTTRPMRRGEKNGIDYEYVDEEKFPSFTRPALSLNIPGRTLAATMVRRVPCFMMTFGTLW